MTEQVQKNNALTQFIEKISLILLAIYIFIAPIAFFEKSLASVFDFPKWFLTIAVACLMLLLWVVYSLSRGSLVLPAKKYTLSSSLFIVAIILSIIFSDSNKWAFLMGKAGFLISFSVILFCGLAILNKAQKVLLSSLFASAFILSWFEILSFFEILPKILKSSVFASKAFTPIGSQIALVSFLAIVLLILVYIAFKAKDVVFKILLFVIAAIQTLALTFAIAQILPGQVATPRYLPYNLGWSITLDQLKSGKSALFGSGLDRFAIAYNKFKPATVNVSNFWYVNYPSSSNEWFTLLATIGVVGIVAMGLLVVTFSKSAFKNKSREDFSFAVSLAWFINLLLLTLVPGNFALFFLLFILALLVGNFSDENKIVIGKKSTLILLIPFLIISVGSAYFLSKASMAEIAYGQSLKALSENDAVKTYNLQIEAIKNNPYNSVYRLAYSNTNIALANALASNQELVDEDKQKIAQLVSQSIREAKATVALDPENANSWINLAKIYRQLINFAQGADQWAVAAYVQAIRLDNTNPQLRLDLGGLLFALGQYENAIDQFKQAIVLKPNMANAYYNLANAYLKTNNPVQAYNAMQNVVKLIDPNSSDYDKAVNELNQVAKLLPQQQAQSATMAAQPRESQLKTPEPVPTPNPETQVEVENNPNQVEEPTFNPDEQSPVE